MRKLKILLYGDQNLNILDGSAVWLSSLANILTQDSKVDLDILLKTPIKRDVIKSNIENLEQVNFINPFETYKNYDFQDKNRMTPEDAPKIMSKLNVENHYHVVITRGKDLTNNCLDYDFSNKQIPYITDFTHDKEKISDEEVKFLRTSHQIFPYIFVQTEEMANFLADLLAVNKDKFILLSPTVPQIVAEPSTRITDQSFVYAGKFSSLWGIDQLLSSFKGIYEKYDKNINLNIAGDKFQADLNDVKEDITNEFNNNEKINWVGGVSRKESLRLISESDVGYAFRSKEIDHDGSLELSTKVLEYGALGKPVILRRTKPYENLLGRDYPLFVDHDEQLTEVMIKSIEDEDVYAEAAKRCYSVSLNHQVHVLSKSILEYLWEFNNEMNTVLFAGHDFKFINRYIDYLEGNTNVNVLIDHWQGHGNHDAEESHNMLNQADIIFCEWGLGNLEYYSHNLLRGQKLIVRLHRQEIETNYPNLINWDNVDHIIVVSAHMFEEFSRRHSIPRNKMIIIPNMVDLNRFKYISQKESSFNIGLLGMLPSLKRPDRAIDLFEKLWENDPRYKLYIKSKLPEDLPWLMNRQQEKDYYEQLYKRIEQAPWQENVVFESHGDDVEEWFEKINYILSTSDIESFHLAPIEGIATGSVPVIFNWDGAKTIYPQSVIFNNIDEAHNFMLTHKTQDDINEDLYGLVSRFKQENIFDKFDQLLFNGCDVNNG